MSNLTTSQEPSDIKVGRFLPQILAKTGLCRLIKNGSQGQGLLRRGFTGHLNYYKYDELQRNPSIYL
jgi:hypothetical protein